MSCAFFSSEKLLAPSTGIKNGQRYPKRATDVTFCLSPPEIPFHPLDFSKIWLKYEGIVLNNIKAIWVMLEKQWPASPVQLRTTASLFGAFFSSQPKFYMYAYLWVFHGAGLKFTWHKSMELHCWLILVPDLSERDLCHQCRSSIRLSAWITGHDV